jgi:hypothetical protein
MTERETGLTFTRDELEKLRDGDLRIALAKAAIRALAAMENPAKEPPPSIESLVGSMPDLDSLVRCPTCGN